MNKDRIVLKNRRDYVKKYIDRNKKKPLNEVIDKLANKLFLSKSTIEKDYWGE